MSEAPSEVIVELLRRYEEASRRGLFPRLAAGSVTGAVLYTSGHTWSVFWCAALFLYELVISPRYVKYVLEPATASSPRLALHLLAARVLVGSFLYAIAWVAAAAFCGPVGQFIGVNWFCGTLAYALVYFSAHRETFIAGSIAPLIGGLSIPIVAAGFSLNALAMEIIAVQTVLIIMAGVRDRAVLQSNLVKSQGEKLAADQASRAKSQFIATMSHELRTPLNAVIGYAEILEEDLHASDNDVSAEDARRVRRAALHLLSLINSVLDLSKIEAGRAEINLRVSNLASVIEDIAATLQPLAANNSNRLVLHLAPDLGQISTDELKLRQCILNLASNANKFTNGGSVTIRAAREGTDAVIAVTDTGIGLSPDECARLFQPFEQMDGSLTRAHEGTGLGLFISRKLARMLGGDITVVSEKGKGSTFTLRLADLQCSPQQIAAAA